MLVPLFLDEPHSVAAADWYSHEKCELVAAAWRVLELANALGIKQRTGAIDVVQARGIWILSSESWPPTSGYFQPRRHTSVALANGCLMLPAHCTPAIALRSTS